MTKDFPKEEIYGLTSQMRRAAVSVPANIAEGCTRSGDIEFARFLQMSIGSASELKYYFLLSRDLFFIDQLNFQESTREIDEIMKMSTVLVQKLKANR